MTSSFRRAQLRGSEELFQQTSVDEKKWLPQENAAPLDVKGSHVPDTAHTRLIRLSEDDITLLADALQKLKFPGSAKPSTKPPVDEFEKLDDLRQKLLKEL